MPERRIDDRPDEKLARRSIIFNTLFSAVGYHVPVSVSYLALWLGFSSSYTYLQIAFFQLAIFVLTGCYLALTYFTTQITREFSDRMFYIQICGWLSLYIFWVLVLGDLRFYGLVSSFVVFTFVFARGNFQQTLLIVCCFVIVHLACCVVAIRLLNQPGNLRYEAFLTYQFFLVYLFLGWMGLRIFNQKRALIESKTTLESTKQELEQAMAVLKKAAFTDTLTGLFNRRAMNQVLDSRSKPSYFEFPDVVVMCDIDHFKAINDRYGHDAGDVVLQEISNRIKKSLRKNDCVARWGGEEFLILLDATDIETADTIANQLRDVIKASPLRYEQEDIYVTASFGLAMMYDTDDTNESIRLADKALYQAKKAGRDCVFLASSEK